MEPLDLTAHPPRSPRDKLLDCYFLPRTIDKLRAELPGGRLGPYFVTGQRSLSAYVLHKLKLDLDELRAVVARAHDESEVEAWLRERVDPAVVTEINGKLAASRVDNLDASAHEFVFGTHPLMRGRTDITTIFDLLEADDAATSSA